MESNYDVKARARHVPNENPATTVEHFVTVFDYSFAPQGLALYRSLDRHVGDFTLWVLAMDARLEGLLDALALEKLRVVTLDTIETDALRAVRPTRSQREYCWTLTPFLYGAVFNHDPGISRVTYVDADIWVRASIAPVFKEFENSGKKIQITEHAFSPARDASEDFGKYCVQFQTMARHGSEEVRAQWEGQCLEWCFGKPADGKFGDQKYLDAWPADYPDVVHVAQTKHFFLGPWNATRFPFSDGLIYHFHQVRINPDGAMPRVGSYELPPPLVANVYRPYLEEIRAVHEIMRSFGFEPANQFAPLSPRQRLTRWLSPVTDPLYKVVRKFNRALGQSRR